MAIRHKIKMGIEVTLKDVHDNIHKHVRPVCSGWNTSFISFSWFEGGTLERRQDHFKFINRWFSLAFHHFFCLFEWIIERSLVSFTVALCEHRWTPDMLCVCNVDSDIHRHYVWNWQNSWNFVMECWLMYHFFLNSALLYMSSWMIFTWMNVRVWFFLLLLFIQTDSHAFPMIWTQTLKFSNSFYTELCYYQKISGEEVKPLSSF